MFDLVFRGLEAYQQVGLLLGALLCFSLGALIVGNAVYLRLFAWRVTGTIIGVIAKGRSYAPVYRYVTPDGIVREAESTVRSSRVAGNDTGRVVPLLVSPGNPARAQESGFRSLDTIFTAVGLLFLMIAFWLGHVAITAYRFNAMTWVMAAGILVYLGWRFSRHIIPKGQRLSLADWRKQRNLGTNARVELTAVKPIEQIVPPAEVKQAREEGARQSLRAAPIVGILAAVLAAAAIYQGATIADLEARGLRAQGKVIRLKSESSSPSVYYPVVRYRTERNKSVVFKGDSGSNPPSYRVGDEVGVLYLPDRPQRAVIDRGWFWNWCIPALLAVGAGLSLVWLLAMLRASRMDGGQRRS